MGKHYPLPEGRGGFRTVRLTADLYADLQARAAERGQLTYEMAHTLLARIAEDDLFDAVLDEQNDGEENE
ncbi:MAG: hypothetical protein CSA68_04720 [Rhodobacterales bacterium]|nr:MAG: hypothetical protein CSA68_04720 [Rhodobacterales bacterium]